MKKISKYRYLIFSLFFLYQAINLIFNWTEINTLMIFLVFMYAFLSSLLFHLQEKSNLEAVE